MLLDKEKLLEWLREREKESSSDIYAASYLSVICEILSGKFDAQGEQVELFNTKYVFYEII